jgi:hypothetical protein
MQKTRWRFICVIIALVSSKPSSSKPIPSSIVEYTIISDAMLNGAYRTVKRDERHIGLSHMPPYNADLSLEILNIK